MYPCYLRIFSHWKKEYSQTFLKVQELSYSPDSTSGKPKIRNRAVDKHSFIADPYPAVLLNPDPDPDPAT